MKVASYPNQQKVTLTINTFENGLNTSKDQSKTSSLYATNLYNFDFSSGNLKDGLGFANLLEHLTSGQELQILKNDISYIGQIEKVFHFYNYNQDLGEQDKLIIINSDLELYYIDLFSSEKKLNYIRDIKFTSIPVAERYRLDGVDVMIFSSETDNMVVWDGINEPYQVLDAPKISSMAIHYERLFATVDGEKNAIWFSDDLDPTNWSVSLEEAGFIQLIDQRGALQKVVSFCDYVYIFREYGISRLSAFASQDQFTISNLFVSSGKIYPSSVCVCGDRIIFLASDGLYAFDGLNTTKILSNITNNLTNINNQQATSCYFNGCYYLACKFNFDMEENFSCDQNNALLEIDIHTSKLKNISKYVDIKYITSINTSILNGVIAITKQQDSNYFITLLNNSGSYIGQPLYKCWSSPISQLSHPSKQKTLKKIFITTKSNCFITINTENQTSTYPCLSNGKTSVIQTNIPCNEFGFSLHTQEQNSNISNLQFEFYVSNIRQ